MVQVLIQAGCDLSLVDQQYGRSAAHWAAFYHREDIFTELIIAGMYVCVCVCVVVLCNVGKCVPLVGLC